MKTVKRVILMMFTGLMLAGCVAEDTSDCPTMYVSFRLDDKYEPTEDYDSRIGHDVLLYIFQNNKLTHSEQIPYSAIAGQTRYAIDKTPDILGDIELVAWAVPAGQNVADYHPAYTIGDEFNRQFVDLRPHTRAGEIYQPVHHELYLGRNTAREHADGNSHHQMAMIPASCRVEVNLHDPDGNLLNSQQNLHILVNGVMSQMDLDRKGTGQAATIRTQMDGKISDGYSTGRFGVHPSSAGQMVSVTIMNGDSEIETLTVPTDNLPKGAQSGELLVFDYTLDAQSFNLRVDGFDVNIVIVDGM